MTVNFAQIADANAGAPRFTAAAHDALVAALLVTAGSSIGGPGSKSILDITSRFGSISPFSSSSSSGVSSSCCSCSLMRSRIPVERKL